LLLFRGGLLTRGVRVLHVCGLRLQAHLRRRATVLSACVERVLTRSCHRGLLIQHIFLQLYTPLQLKLIDFFRCLSLLSFTAVRTALDTLKVGESPLTLSNLRVCKTTPEECLHSSRLHLEHRLARVNAQIVVFGLQVAMCQIHMRWQLNLGNDFNGV